ncbi:CCNJL [Cordylochernes scorpioides]|uniref:CCNJL n=1 Tax=Cordylochernes scorpioides TaxID=51811 RepID=A0ABY6JXI1_9ARAC|nr:CCNJL [Cordylochernes scorpioides]UYV60819.1 CCNJL [Cordylochernes scorpioides]
MREQSRHKWGGHSPQLHLRPWLVGWLEKVVEIQKLSGTVRHLATYLLDIFMDHHFIQEGQLQMVALGCLLIAAAKLEEKDGLIPKTSELNAHVNNCYNLSEFVRLELMLLHFFRWELMLPTAAHFVEIFSPFLSGERRLCHYISLFLDLSLQPVPTNAVVTGEALISMPPSLVAAACIAAARSTLQLKPVWPGNLEKLTRYRLGQVRTLANSLLLTACPVCLDPRSEEEGSPRSSSSSQL